MLPVELWLLLLFVHYYCPPWLASSLGWSTWERNFKVSAIVRFSLDDWVIPLRTSSLQKTRTTKRTILIAALYSYSSVSVDFDLSNIEPETFRTGWFVFNTFCVFFSFQSICFLDRIDHNGHPLPLDVTDYKVSLLVLRKCDDRERITAIFSKSLNVFACSSSAPSLSVNLKHQAPMVIIIILTGYTVFRHRFVRWTQITYVVDFVRLTDSFGFGILSRRPKWSISSY